MNLLQKTILFACCAGIFSSTAMSPEVSKSQQALTLEKQAAAAAQDVAQVLFNPTSNPYPTVSLNEKKIDDLFGPLHAKIGTDTIRFIKNFYFYLEYVTKVERAARMAALATQTQLVDSAGKPIDFLGLMGNGGWQAVLSALKKKYTTDAQLTQALTTVQTPAWSLAIGAIKASSWQTLIASDFWSAIAITTDDLTQSMIWQEYINFMITQAFAYDNSLLAAINQAQASMFRYVPDIETVYYHPDYTRLRHMAELLRINLILTDNLRNRYLKSSAVWKQYSTSLQKAYEASLVYAKKPLYTYFSTAEEQFNKTVSDIEQKQFRVPDALVQEPLAIERITFIAMTKNLHALLQPLYTLDNLSETSIMLSKSPLVPDFMVYAQEDTYLLEDRASLMSLVAQAAQPAQQQLQPTVQTVALRPPSFGIENDVIVQSFWSIFEHAGSSILHFGKSIFEGTEALACKTGAAFMGTFSKKIANDLKAQASALTKKSHNDFDAGYKDVMNTIDDIATTAQTITGGVGKAIGFMLGKGVEDLFDSMNKRIIKGTAGLLQSVAGFAIDTTADLAHLVTDPVSNIVCLSLEAVTMTGHFLWDTMTLQGGNLGADLKDFEQFGTHLITSILDAITLPITAAIDNLKDVIKIVSYIVSNLTDTFINIATGVAFFATTLVDMFGAGINPVSAGKSTAEALEAHRRTLDSISATALMIGATVATGGAAAPMIAMIGAQQVFQVVGSYQQDELQAEKRQEEKKFLDAYRVFVNNNKVLSTEQQLTWSQELNQKYQAEIINQERNLGFYQNYLNQTFNNYQEQMARQLGSYLSPQLTPDARYNTVYADLGSLYGFSTGVYDFNPSQGFSLYNVGRNNFSQEIAVAPDTDKQKSFVDQPSSKFWFIQQDTYPMAQEPQAIEIRLRAIYVLTTYHIGLYFGGKPYDIQAIKKNSIAPVDAGHLAKMLVFKKTQAAQPAAIGLYQHEASSLDETKNWLFQAPTPNPEFHVGIWYRMKMSMNGPTTLLFKVWAEEETEPTWQQVTVQQQKEPLTTLGVISSGASIEYQILSPEPTISVAHDATVQGNPPVRTPLPTEKDREANARRVMQTLSQITLGSFNLLIADKIALLKNQFIYTTQNTGLQDANGKPMTDYVLLCQLRDDNSVQDATIGKQLEQITSGSAGLISAISGNAYNQSGAHVGVYPTAFSTWLKEHGPLHSALQQAVTETQKSYAARMTSPITFGALTLKPTSEQEILNGQFIYTTATPQLTKNSAPVLDAQGKQLSDFIIFVEENKEHTNILHHNLSPHAPTVNAALSIVSGNVYDNSSPNKIIDSGYGAELEKIGVLRPELMALIVAAQTTYSAQQTKELSGQNATKPTSESAISKHEETATATTDIKTTPTTVSSKSLSEQQKSASDDEICFGC